MAVYLTRTPLFESQAKLFVPYVLDRNVNEDGGSKVTSSAGGAGKSVLNVEVDLLTSWDLVESVARDIGPESILPPGSKSITVADAAGALLKNLQVEVPLNSMVIHASYQHPDPEKARSILGKLVNEYHRCPTKI